MNNQEINRIIIVGAGITGVTVAAAIAKSLPHISITLIGDGDGHSEALSMLPQVHEFHRQLGLDEKELMRATQASFKLAQVYQDWNQTGHRFIQPYGPHGAVTEFVGFQHFATKQHHLGDKTNYAEYALGAIAAENNRFSHPQNDPNSILSTLAYSLHLDAGSYRQFLVDRLLSENVSFNPEGIVDVALDENSGFIQSITLENGEKLEAELFVDCSGKDAVLIEKTLGVGFEDWSGWLPANQVVSIAINSKGEVMPYTQVVGQSKGYLRHVPLLNRIQREFLFNSEEVSTTEAIEIITSGLSPNAISEPQMSEFHSGQRIKQWHKNCIAFGAAAGEFEPIEVSNVQWVQMAVKRFLNLFPDQRCDSALVKEYNRLTELELQHIRDFTLLHYLSVNRNDHSIWKNWRNLDLPETLNNKVSLFKVHGQLASYDEEVFNEGHQASTFIGLGMWPDGHDPFLDAFDLEELKQRFNYMRAAIREAVINMPGHRQYLENYLN